ncbi:MAG: alkyl hydroperoxide reductase subunit F [Rikenellaceae bacterium]
MLDSALKEQVRGILSSLSSHYTLLVELHPQHPRGVEAVEFLREVAECSPKVECSVVDGEALQFSILKDGNPSGVIFRAIPNGHEFTSLLLAILNLDGQGKNLPDDFIVGRIKSLKGEISLSTYMSLTCTNCPDVVQSLNIMAIFADNITHEAVDGALYQEEVDNLGIQSVPTVYANGQLLHVGRGGVADLLTKLEAKYGVEQSGEIITRSYDVLVAGAGPAGATAALYLARKGFSVGVVAERIGGQVNETAAIENISSIVSTTGPALAADLKRHMAEYPTIEVLENRTIESVELEDKIKRLTVKGGEVIESRQLIIATGAQWRRLGVNGESEYIGRGVAFCPHCDGPLFKDKRVAVVGGGNSGVEAAIDLAGICSNVTIFEFLESLKADEVLQKRLRELPNVQIRTNVQTTQIIGDGAKVEAIEIRDRATGSEESVALDGICIQIGLIANSQLFSEYLPTNGIGEIEVDRNCRTTVKGIYAAGDVTDVSYKQIIISMGEGAKAALAAFDDRIRGEY